MRRRAPDDDGSSATDGRRSAHILGDACHAARCGAGHGRDVAEVDHIVDPGTMVGQPRRDLRLGASALAFSRSVTSAAAVPSVDSSPGLRALPATLSLVAGSADVISFLGLGGLFVAHITGNLVILAAHLVAHTSAGVAGMISVPLFIVVLALTRLLVARLEDAGIATLRPLLLLQALLLALYLVLGVAAVSTRHPYAASAVVAGSLGVSAMAVQNAMVQVALRDAPTTAVMTTDVTRYVMDVGAVLLGRDAAAAAQARRRAARTWPAIVGFALGAGAGAALYAAVGLSSLALPAGLAVVALLIALLDERSAQQVDVARPTLPPRQA